MSHAGRPGGLSHGPRRPVDAREVARRVLDRVAKDAAWATPTLDGELAHVTLDDRDRRLASELVHGVLRHRSRIDRALAAHADLKKTHPRVVTALRVAAYQILMLDRVPGYAAVDDAVHAARSVGGPKLAGFANAVLRKLTVNGEPALPVVDGITTRSDALAQYSYTAPAATQAQPRPSLATQLAYLEVACSLPRWILDELVGALGEDAQELIAEIADAFTDPAPLVARANLRRTTRDALVAELARERVTATPIGDAPMALRLEGLGDPARSASFKAGAWTVQDTGAQLVALTAAPAAGQRILDACSGVGGKATHLAELADDAAHIDAADLSATKLALCAVTARRLGLASITHHACDLLDPAAPLGARYDLIVLDAPCTGLGVLRRHPDAKWRLKADDVPRLAVLQRMLIDAVLPRLAPGGTLVYSVCTFTRAEGADQIAALLARSDLELVEEHRTWPPEADAFYLAKLTKPAS